MKIAVNTRLLLPNQLEGIGWFAHELLRRLVHNHPKVTFHFFFDRPFDQRFVFGDNVQPHVLFPPARHPLLWYAWFEWAVYRKMQQLRPDVFFSPEAYLSLQSRVPTIMTIHDLSVLHYPEHVNWANRRYVRHFYPRFVKKAHQIVTVSQFSKQDIIQHYPDAAAKIQVVYNGARQEYRGHTPREIEVTRNQYSEGNPYFLYVGALQPRKNISRLLQAFDQFKNGRPNPFRLLLVGRKAWMTDHMESVYQKMTHREAVHFLDYQPLEVVSQLMGAAHALAYVSLFEGFGIPLLEAMQSGVPVLTSNTTSMPEVAGEAGLCVNPEDVEAIAQGFSRLAFDTQLYQKMCAATALQAAKFRWDASAEKLWRLLNQ